MNRERVIGILAVALLAGGALWYAGMLPAPLPPVKGPVAIPTGIAKISEDAPYYAIDISYPTTTPIAQTAGTGADQAAVALIKGYFDAYAATFKKEGNFANLTQKDIQMVGFDRGRKESLSAVYLISTSARSVSYIYTIVEDTLGAHPNTFFKTFTFDLGTGKLLSIADIFTAGTPYLDRLSAVSRTYLAQNLGQYADTQMLDNGTAPDAKNFQNFFIDNGTLAILFAPYDVAAYAAGPQTVRIPLSELSDILKPAYLAK
ncbi:MAG: DUF3298 domain-containing protein [Patescibacteria group bacterium]|nr:DUF3298 domain-containing protein [Patescibacteria group bacterium]MDE1966062.1 DUF3298 domain-containing protein [Patescibacteria group bacterium]